ncbi:hypothetical protein FBY35_1100 [Streptomyces sp. SLBN-118]|uniref:hypothetical protein n=1 Tax=Streptomyces sp. SLBN-118 TaxID=2768454 RepID=UPI00115369F2|nr:hypothetical protein [Streptomyces sp. SLBN-118]TQK50751.1 hypothetical protein FBY35_1100 [Streptomyces sp. SLBN-118]
MAMLLTAVIAQVWHPVGAKATTPSTDINTDIMRTDTANIGWDGDSFGVAAHSDGSFDVREYGRPDNNNRAIVVRFGIYNNYDSNGRPATPLQWTNVGGYYPALQTKFERDNCTVTITNFGDKVKAGGHSYVAIYSRVQITNHDTVSHTLDPAVSSIGNTQGAGLVPLQGGSNSVAPGTSVSHSYVIAADKMGAGDAYGWPSSSDLAAALPDDDSGFVNNLNVSRYDNAYTHMTRYWDGQLSKIASISVPDSRLTNAYKAGFIYTQMVKDGTRYNVGENDYDTVFDHDEIGIYANLLSQGYLSDLKDRLSNSLLKDVGATGLDYIDAGFKYAWPWAVYLLKTGDTATVHANFDTIASHSSADSIINKEEKSGAYQGLIVPSNSTDSNGHWLVDDQSALLGLQTYSYIARTLSSSYTDRNYGQEATAADAAYGNLLNAVNSKLNNTITSNNLNYLPCDPGIPNTTSSGTANNACGKTNNANWGAMFLFGRWNWDGSLFPGARTGPMVDKLDATYDHGFGALSGLPAHTYGGYPSTINSSGGYSTAYNAGYGEAALASTNHRSEGIYGYQFMITNTQSGPFSWWEGIPTAGYTSWTPGRHATAGTGSSPHMWGQANASHVLLDSLIAEKSDGTIIVGDGVPTEWVRPSWSTDITVSNYPISGGHRMGIKITTADTDGKRRVTLTRSGDQPSGKIVFKVPAFVNNIEAVSTGTKDDAQGTVTVDPGNASVTVTLKSASFYNSLGGLDLDGYCKSIGETGGARLTGNMKAYDWKCVTPSGQTVGLSVDDACTYAYPENPSVFSLAASDDPYSWKCYAKASGQR